LQNLPLYNEKEILLGIAEGNESAFNTVFELYRNKLYNYLLKITKSPEISEEIVIDIFVKLWVGRALVQQIDRLEGFLYKVAYHRAIDFLRTTSRHNRLQRAYIDWAAREPEKRADEILIDTQCMQLLREAILRLSPQRRLIYTLSREQGLTHDQIAAALNLSRNTVKNSMMAAVKAISEFLQHHAAEGALSLSLFYF
jgi:RNA polymerase sigma-70 factor (family 1)